MAAALKVTYGTGPKDMKGFPINYDLEPVEIRTSSFEGRLAGLCPTLNI